MTEYIMQLEQVQVAVCINKFPAVCACVCTLICSLHSQNSGVCSL